VCAANSRRVSEGGGVALPSKLQQGSGSTVANGGKGAKHWG
jgi:hypothetical protein